MAILEYRVILGNLVIVDLEYRGTQVLESPGIVDIREYLDTQGSLVILVQEFPGIAVRVFLDIRGIAGFQDTLDIPELVVILGVGFLGTADQGFQDILVILG